MRDTILPDPMAAAFSGLKVHLFDVELMSGDVLSAATIEGADILGVALRLSGDAKRRCYPWHMIRVIVEA